MTATPAAVRADSHQDRPSPRAPLPFRPEARGSQTVLHYEDPINRPDGGVMLIPYVLAPGVRPYQQVVDLLALYRALEAQVDLVRAERDQVLTALSEARGEAARALKKAEEWERQVKRLREKEKA